MDYIVNVTEANFSEVWQATQQIPVVFSFTSLQDVASIETDAMLRRLVDEYPKQFLLATVTCDAISCANLTNALLFFKRSTH